MDAVSSLNAQKGFVNQALGISDRIAGAIKLASAQVGVDFSYMLNKATQESGLNPNAKAKTSSATGLYQFVDQTWLRMVKNYGEKYGLGAAADQIIVGSDGVARVSDPTIKKAILTLRKDPEISAKMAAELTKENKTALKSEVGGKIGSTELYLAHFLGANGASDFLNKMRANPNAKAAEVLPEAASANASVFYDKAGQPRSLKQIYSHFAKKFESTPSAVNNVAVASDIKYKPNNYSFDLPVEGLDAGSSGNSSYSSSVMSSYRPNHTMTSPFATMMLAQMGMGEITSSSSNDSANNDEQKKKSALTVLGMAA